MKFVIDMNLSPRWVEVFESRGHEAVHWSDIGSYSAPDSDILDWANENDAVVFTNDLDFGAIIAATGAEFLSVIQIRGLDVMPEASANALTRAIAEHESHLVKGALVSVDAVRSRAHILPIRDSEV